MRSPWRKAPLLNRAPADVALSHSERDWRWPAIPSQMILHKKFGIYNHLASKRSFVDDQLPDWQLMEMERLFATHKAEHSERGEIIGGVPVPDCELRGGVRSSRGESENYYGQIIPIRTRYRLHLAQVMEPAWNLSIFKLRGIRISVIGVQDHQVRDHGSLSSQAGQLLLS